MENRGYRHDGRSGSGSPNPGKSHDLVESALAMGQMCGESSASLGGHVNGRVGGMMTGRDWTSSVIALGSGL